MTCKYCSSFKLKDDGDGIEGLCTSAWLQDATPPTHLKSKKKIREWLESDEIYTRVKSTDAECDHYHYDMPYGYYESF